MSITQTPPEVTSKGSELTALLAAFNACPESARQPDGSPRTYTLTDGRTLTVEGTRVGNAWSARVLYRTDTGPFCGEQKGAGVAAWWRKLAGAVEVTL